MNILEVEKLRKVYQNNVTAVDEVTFHIKKGEIFGLLGPNGAGKSTIIKIISTLLIPTSGNVKVFGNDLNSSSNLVRNNINCILGTERNLYWRLTARENLDYFATLYGIPNKDKKDKIDKLLSLVNLTEFQHRKVETFSKGMKQRLQIIKGLINSPKLLLLDEPTIGLDPLVSLEINQLLLQLKKEGVTILLTTHYLKEAYELCDRVAIINKGKFIYQGTPDKLKQKFPEEKKIIIDLKENTSLIRIKKQLEYNSLYYTLDSNKITFSLENDNKLIVKLLNSINPNNIIDLQIINKKFEDAYIELIRKEG